MTLYLLGIDVGTSVIKAALFDRTGVEVATASVRTNVIERKPGWSELDPETTWTTVTETCRAVLGKAGVTGGAIAGVGVTGVMVGAWLVDGAGATVRRAILWNDSRAQGLIATLVAERPDLFSAIFAHSGSVMQSGCTLPLLAWLARHEPDRLAAARSILTAKDFVRLRLTGVSGTDETEAAVAPGSAPARTFSPDAAALLRVERLTALLPPVGRSEAIAGAVTAAAAMQTGLRAGTPVAFGAGDTPASVIGAGLGSPGYASTVLGTTCLNGVVLAEPSFEPTDLGLLFTVPGRLWMKTMVNVAGTSNIDWCLHALCPDLAGSPDPYEALAALAKAGGVGAGGVTYIPYLSSGGIIAPRIEPGARGSFVGLEPRHGRQHLVRALYEGVALSIRDCFEAIARPMHAVRLAGGGAQSAFWSQMIADILGVPVEVPVGTQFGAKGAALLAGVGIGWYGSVEEACRATFTLERCNEPDGDKRDAYEASFRRYKTASTATLDGIAPSFR